jgi:NAD+ kinase
MYHFVASSAKIAQERLSQLLLKYSQTSAENAKVIVALGGDGFLMHILHEFRGETIFPLNCGSLGFLTNHYSTDVDERVKIAKSISLHPLQVRGQLKNDEELEAFAYNDVTMTRQSPQASHLQVILNGKEALAKLVGDGILVSTPCGSTAYNFSAGGPILPLDSNLMALTPICPFRPRRWRGALLPQSDCIRINNVGGAKRPVKLTVDHKEFGEVMSIAIRRDIGSTTILSDNDLDLRFVMEQFNGVVE